MKKRIVSFLLALVMAVSNLCPSAPLLWMGLIPWQRTPPCSRGMMRLSLYPLEMPGMR